MIIKVDNNLKRQEIWANGIELASIMGKDRRNGKRIMTFPENKKEHVHTFKNPVLMSDNYRIAKLNPTLRDTLFFLYGSKPRIVEYDGVSVLWGNSHINVWCPSIDTVVFAKALKKLLRRKNNFKTAVEIGCGSGFLSKYLLAKNKKIKSILVNDINPYAIKCAKDNIKDKRAEFYTGNGLKKIRGRKFDLILCNPPYIPRPNSIDDNAYEGVGLLNYFVHRGQRHLNKNGVLVTNISSLCRDIILKEKPAMKIETLEKKKVPLKINNVLNNKRWLNYLINRGLKRKNHKGYEYWQKINIVALYFDRIVK